MERGYAAEGPYDAQVSESVAKAREVSRLGLRGVRPEPVSTAPMFQVLKGATAETVDRTLALADRLEETVDRLLGYVPTPTPTPPERDRDEAPESLTDEIGRYLRELQKPLTRIERATARLRDALG